MAHSAQADAAVGVGTCGAMLVSIHEAVPGPAVFRARVAAAEESRMRADAHVRAAVVPPLNLSPHGIDPPPVNHR